MGVRFLVSEVTLKTGVLMLDPTKKNMSPVGRLLALRVSGSGFRVEGLG